MRKRILAIPVVIVSLLAIVGLSNKSMQGGTRTYDAAIIKLANGDVVEGDVEKLSRYETSGLIQVKIEGITYLVHSVNCTFMQR